MMSYMFVFILNIVNILVSKWIGFIPLGRKDSDWTSQDSDDPGVPGERGRALRAEELQRLLRHQPGAFQAHHGTSYLWRILLGC